MHPSVKHVLDFFRSGHLPPYLSVVAKPCEDLARKMAQELPPSPEVTVGLRKLLEAKDCFVRAKLPVKEPSGESSVDDSR